MGRVLKGQGHILIALLGGILAVTFLMFPVPAEATTEEEKLKRAEALFIKASEMASKAQETSGIELTQKALELTRETSVLLAEIAFTAQETGDTDLAQEAMTVVNNLVDVVKQIMKAAQYIVQTSIDSHIVDAAREVLGRAEEVQNLNRATINTALATGVAPDPAESYKFLEEPRFKIPLQEEPHIHDTEPASPI